MDSLKHNTIVVAGGTGNVGSFIVRQLLQSGARVCVPSRSDEKLTSLRQYLKDSEVRNMENLYTFNGNISDENRSEELLSQIADTAGTPDGAISSLGGFIPAPSLLEVETEKLREVMDNYLYAHFAVARAFLPLFKSRGGTFVFVNGPLALHPWKGAGLVSISTAAQQMLFRALAKELEGTKARTSELMTYAYIRNRQTQPGSDVSGEAVGALAAWMVSDEANGIHGKTIPLKTMEKLNELKIDLKV